MTHVFMPGETFLGYTIERLLGEGGLGSVWLARHGMLDTLYAVKVLDRDVAKAKPEYVKRFVREAKLASKIHHPNLVAVHDAGYDDGRDVYYLVMDYVRGDTLRLALALGGPRPEGEAVEIILQIAGVLETSQQYGLVHRDLKPENIMVTPDGTVRLLDLGVAKVSNNMDSLRTMAASVFGTPSYIAPEQAVDSSTVDPRADVYSLGVILFELLSGRRPYDGKTPTDVLRQLLDSSPIPDVRDFAPG
ncbi:MAG: serine/threonine protein kinase, partial [Kiritimatiellae bacterium]|nr:serine/threonine protein kinase [Kiritimatiellia bacterium]